MFFQICCYQQGIAALVTSLAVLILELIWVSWYHKSLKNCGQVSQSFFADSAKDGKIAFRLAHSGLTHNKN